MSTFERKLYRQWVRYFKRGHMRDPLAPGMKREAYVLARDMQLPPLYEG